MRRVGRLKAQLYRGLVRFQPLPDCSGAVHPAMVHHQRNLPIRFLHDPLRKLPGDLRRDRTFPHGVLELALRTAGRQPGEAETPAGHPPDGGLTARAPGAPGHALRSQAGLVGAGEQGSPLLGPAKDIGELFVFPPLPSSGMVPGGAPLGPLRGESEPPQAPAHRGDAQDAAKLLPPSLAHSHGS